LDASIAPSDFPADQPVCISSMNRMMSPEACFTSSEHALQAAPRIRRGYLAPAIHGAHV
jgi:hypothetical protein